MEITLNEDDFLAIYDTFAAHYIGGGDITDITEAEEVEFDRLVALEDRAWKVVQRVYARHYSE
jgi:hypothetical protein|tara:strand:- start:921 stop:1109 length:189 start_codon:yes stop_codon:yes gene_type:complete